MDITTVDKKVIRAMKKAEYMNKYYKINTDKMKGAALSRYNNNRHCLIEKQKQYYIKNRDRITHKYKCECGGTHTYINKNKHRQTKKHLKYISSQTNTIKIRIINNKL